MKVRVIRRNRLACQSGNVLRLRGLCETTGRWLKSEKDRPVLARHWRITGPERLLKGALPTIPAQSPWQAVQPSEWLRYDFGGDAEIVS
jgi:hypothetical protein